MCNACGFQCCAYDGFSGCGCDHCEEPACWSDDEFEHDDEEFDYDTDQHDRATARGPTPALRNPGVRHIAHLLGGGGR